ncbi:MAG: hypothetical protein AAFQ33_16595, partial [Pseudomonadota bacterium]
GQVDFQSIGFTLEVFSPSRVPLTGSLPVTLLGFIGFGGTALRKRASPSSPCCKRRIDPDR